MNIVFVLLPLTILLGLVFLWGYRWSVRNGQFEDLDTPAVRILTDDVDRKEER
jgi:cbb3-type cytochrome oxidase maturation protein